MADQSRPPPVPGYPAPPYPAQHSTNPPANGYPPPPSNTAYPYPAMPPPQYYNPNAYYATPRATFLRRFFAILIGLFIISGVILFIMWLVLRPKLPEFQVDSMTVSDFNVSDFRVTGNWDVGFSVRNPNKKLNIYYDRIDSYLYYQTAFLSESTIPPFVQGTKNQTVVTASFASRANYVDGSVVNDINDKRKVGIVGFDVKVLASVRFSSGAWRARRRLLRVFCNNVKVKLSSSNGTSGKLQSGNWECRVGL